METKTLIQATANILRVTSLTKGDVIKIVEKEYSSTEIHYAVVLDLLNTGSETFIQLLKYKKSYSQMTAEIVTYSGDKDLAIFPATVEEVKEHLNTVLIGMEKDIKQEKADLQKKIEALESATAFVSGEKSKKLKSASFTKLTQDQFDKEVKQVEHNED